MVIGERPHEVGSCQGPTGGERHGHKVEVGF